MKKMLAALLAALMVLSLAACGGSAKTYKIGICQLVQHPALDAATQGFKDVLTEKLGDKVVFDEPQRAVAPGQSVVFYKDGITLGGGIISKAIKA